MLNVHVLDILLNLAVFPLFQDPLVVEAVEELDFHLVQLFWLDFQDLGVQKIDLFIIKILYQPLDNQINSLL